MSDILSELKQHLQKEANDLRSDTMVSLYESIANENTANRFEALIKWIEERESNG